MTKHHITLPTLLHQPLIRTQYRTLRRRLVHSIIHQYRHILLPKSLHLRQIPRHVVNIVVTSAQLAALTRVVDPNEYRALRVVFVIERPIRGGDHERITNIDKTRRRQLRNLFESLIVQNVAHATQYVHPGEVVLVLVVLVMLVEHLEQCGRARASRFAGRTGELKLGVDVGHVRGGLGVVRAGDHAYSGRDGLLGGVGELLTLFGRGLFFGFGGRGARSVAAMLSLGIGSGIIRIVVLGWFFGLLLLRTGASMAVTFVLRLRFGLSGSRFATAATLVSPFVSFVIIRWRPIPSSVPAILSATASVFVFGFILFSGSRFASRAAVSWRFSRFGFASAPTIVIGAIVNFRRLARSRRSRHG
mmetsp:Transcript_33206/g.69855  ORF Transcript_33206/g.69855 Transcript_33206/m.69855 type:complete len:360 (+) Transcript_33206:132-1211(+)